MQDNKLFIYTGAGIVADSNALDEWQELDIKMESYLSMTYDISYQQWQFFLMAIYGVYNF